MRRWQSVLIPVCAMDGELLRPLHALQFREATQRHSRRARSEAEHLRPLVAIKGLERTPPPNDVGVRRRVPDVVRSCAPFVDVNVRRSRDEQLKLLLVELEEERMRH